MSQIIELHRGRLFLAARRGFRNWKTQFKEDFGVETRLSHLSWKVLSYLAEGKGRGTFYLYDLIMHLNDWGSGLEFNELNAKNKMSVIDAYLFVLDQLRYELMKRYGWLESYPGEDITLVELIADFGKTAPNLQARVPDLAPTHPGYREFLELSTYDRESFIRRLIPDALKRLKEETPPQSPSEPSGA